jgi:hypothetical protein
MKVVRLTKIYLNGTYIRVLVGKDFSDNFLTRNGLKQDDALLPLVFNLTLDYAFRKVQKNQVGLKLNEKGFAACS